MQAKELRKDNSKVQALLEESFHCVTRAYTMVEALAAIAKQPFDLFLIDHEPASGESACPLLTAIMSEDSMAHIPSIGAPRPSSPSPSFPRNTFTQVPCHPVPPPASAAHTMTQWPKPACAYPYGPPRWHAPRGETAVETRGVTDERRGGVCVRLAAVMSREDNQSSVAQCLHLGAVDYLVKPLRRNELNNLWAHVWRRRMVRRPSELQSNPSPSDPLRKALTLCMCSSSAPPMFVWLLGRRGGAPRADADGPVGGDGQTTTTVGAAPQPASQPSRTPHTRANFGTEAPHNNTSSGSDEERQGTGDDEEAGSAGSNCESDMGNVTGGSVGKKSDSPDKAVRSRAPPSFEEFSQSASGGSRPPLLRSGDGVWLLGRIT